MVIKLGGNSANGSCHCDLFEGYQQVEHVTTTKRSIVYRAYSCARECTVIIKLFRLDSLSSKMKHKIRREFEVAQHLMGNSNVVQCFELRRYGSGKQQALILEDSHGTPLRTDKTKYGLDEFLTIAISIIEGLATIHRSGVIHQNITPKHLLYNDKTGEIKFTDFGLSSMLNKQYQPVINIKNFTDCLEYISPEQTGLHRDLDYRTDFYSLGVVFYQMITGKLPFENNDHSKLIYSHIAKTPMLPHEVNSSIPLVISKIIMKMLAKSADDRYQSCFGIKMDLQLLLFTSCLQISKLSTLS